jgi:hypothetical protein
MEVTNEQQRRRPDGMEGLGNQKGVIIVGGYGVHDVESCSMSGMFKKEGRE